MDKELQLRLLGDPRVTLDGVPLAGLAHKKSLALLCYLAVTGRPRSREVLSGLLWGEATEANARGGLRKGLADLRRQVAPHLTITRQQVAFNHESPHWLDVEAFNWRIGEVLGQRSIPLPDEGAAALAEAVELYQGDFMDGFYVRRAPAFEEWALLERERLRSSVLRALYLLATHYAAYGAYPEAIEYTARVLALAPEQEEAHRQMMSLLALSGQQGAALHQYKVCCQMLARELSVEPSEETTDLYERIRNGTEPQAPFPTLPHNVPAPLTPFIGRESLLVEITESLRDPGCRLLTLVGPGGIGKTRLVLEAARALLSGGDEVPFADGLFFVPLAAIQSVGAIVHKVAQVLRFSFYSEKEPKQQLLDYLRQKTILLILDGFEHLLISPSVPSSEGATEETDLVVELLRAAPGIKIVTTSRVKLNLQGEHLLPVSGLSFPQTLPEARLGVAPNASLSAPCVQDVAQYSAVQLFLAGTRRVQPGFEPSTTDLVDIARICLLADGMPLAILLATSWMEALTPAEIVAEIVKGIDVLRADWPDVPERQRSVRSVYNHSWRLLTEREQETFAALSVFRGGFGRQAAERVTGVSLRELLTLINRSMLHRTSMQRYEMHELLRQYAAEKLAQSPCAHRAMHDQHCAYYAGASQAWATDLRGPRQQAALGEIEADIENVRAAWSWAVQQGQVEYLARALDGLCHFYEWRGRWQDGEAACRMAATMLEDVPPGDGLRVLAKVLSWQSVFGDRLGRGDLIDQLLRHRLEILDNSDLAGQDVRAERAFALFRLSKNTFYSDLEEASRLAEQSLSLYRGLGDRWGAATVLEHRGSAALQSGDYRQATPFYQESLTIRRALGDRRGIADSLEQQSYTLLFQGRLEEGKQLAVEHSAIRREIGDPTGIVKGLVNWGSALFWLGQFAEAYAHPLVEEALPILNDLGDQVGVAECTVYQSWTEMHLGLYERARVLAQESLALSREFNDRHVIGLSCWALGCIALAENAHAAAEQWLQESVIVFREIGKRDGLSYALAALACVTCGSGQPARARQYLSEAIEIAAEIQVFWTFMFPLPAMALLLANQGKVERAVELYALASRYPFVANSRWFEDIAGKRVAAIATVFSPDLTAAAQDRGRARDLDATVKELLVELEGQ